MKPRLLVIELHHLGDAVLSLPFVRGAQARHDVHVLCRPATRAVYDLLPTRPKVHVWEPPWANEQDCSGLDAISAARTQGLVLRPLEFEVAVCAWADARAGLIMAESRARQRIGFPMTRGNYYAADHPWRRRRRLLGRGLERVWLGAPLLTLNLHRATADQPHLDCWSQIADALNVAPDFSTPWFSVGPAAESVRAFARDARDRGRQILAIHPHARLPSKQWPLTFWKELLALPSVRERFALLEILPPGSPAPVVAEALSVPTPDLPALVSTLDACDALLVHDSMPAHLAAALGRPVVTIFGSGEPDWFAPWQNRQRVVIQRGCPLHPCIDQCGMDRYLCLDRISIGDVLRHLDDLPALS